MTTTITKVGNDYTMPPCPGCSNNTGHSVSINGRFSNTLRECAGCGALLGRCYRGDSPVLMTFSPEHNPEKTRHFDLDLLGSGGVRRVHGFYNPADMMVTQFG